MPLSRDSSPYDLTRPLAAFNGKPIGTLLHGGAYRYSLNGRRQVQFLGVPARQPVVTAPGGMAYSTAGATFMSYAQMVRSFIIGTDQYITMLVVFRTTTATAGAIFAGLGSNSGSSGNTLIFFKTATGSAAKVNFVTEDGTGNIYTDLDSTTTNTSINDGQWHCAVGASSIINPASGQLFIDGYLEATLAPLAAPTPFAATFQHVCALGVYRAGSIVSTAAIDVALVVPIFGRVTEQEGISLSRNPWQLFELKDEAFDGAAAAAGGFFARHYYDMNANGGVNSV